LITLRLTSVTQNGSDVVCDGAGEVTDVTAQPPATWHLLKETFA
jgi:hypothetical protein